MSMIFNAWILLHLWLLSAPLIAQDQVKVAYRQTKKAEGLSPVPPWWYLSRRCRGTADPARLAPYAWTWSLMPAWSPSCLEKDATMCFISLTFSSAAAPVTKWDRPPSCLAFSFFIKEKPNALESSALINAHVANFTIFFKWNKRAESCKEQLWQKCSCALGLRLPMPLLTFNKTFRTRVPRRASPVVISVAAFYTIHDNRCHRCL